MRTGVPREEKTPSQHWGGQEASEEERKKHVVLEKIIIESPAPALHTLVSWKFFLRSDLTPSYYSRVFLLLLFWPP